MYCIYTDSEVPIELTNEEHIIPLSLGGCNHFVIRTQAQFNSDVGSTIDGKVANDPMINIIRTRKDVRGHSNTPPEMNWKKSFLNGDPNRPVQVSFPPDVSLDPIVWDPKGNRVLSKAEYAGSSFKTSLRINPWTRRQFACKVALSGSYFVFGEKTMEIIDHHSLRQMINMDFSKKVTQDLKGIKLGFLDPFIPIQDKDKDKDLTNIFKTIPKFFDSCALFFFCSQNIIITTGVLGEWIASVNVKADERFFPNHCDFDLGHAVLIKDKNIERVSFRTISQRVLDFISKKST